jgi:SAM-dependent methyltransferase
MPRGVSVTLSTIAQRYGVTVNGTNPITLKAGRDDLPALCQALGFKTGAEVGVWKGAYSQKFCEAGLDWTAIDLWAPYAAYREKKNNAQAIGQAYREAQERLGKYACTFLKMTSEDAADFVPDRSLDICYIDGNHEAPFVTADLERWSQKVRPGGILAGHDYRVPPKEKQFIQVKQAVDAYVAEHQIAPWFVLAGDFTPSFFWVVA